MSQKRKPCGCFYECSSADEHVSTKADKIVAILSSQTKTLDVEVTYSASFPTQQYFESLAARTWF